MDHAEAVTSQAVERYLLGQMPETEVEAFELHFFDCSTCTEELQSGAVLAENVKAAFAREPLPEPLPVPDKRHWLKELWLRPAFAAPAFAALLLAGVVVYQAGQLARVNQPQVLLAAVLKSPQRGAAPAAENRIVVPSGKTHFLITDLDLPNSSFPNYRIDLCDASGRVVFPIHSPAPVAGSSLNILIPVRGLRSGPYTLRVHGVESPAVQPEIGYYRFLLQLP